MRLNRAQLLGAQLPIEEFVEVLERRRAGLAAATPSSGSEAAEASGTEEFLSVVDIGVPFTRKV